MGQHVGGVSERDYLIESRVPRRRVPSKAHRGSRPRPRRAAALVGWIVNQEFEVDSPPYTYRVLCLRVMAAAQGYPETQMLSLCGAELV